MRNAWPSLLLCIPLVGAFGQGTDGPQFDADGVLSDLNGNHVAPLAPGVPMLIRGNSLGPRDYCLPSGLDLQRRQAPSPLLPNANMDNGIVYPTILCGVEVTVGGMPAGLMGVGAREITFKVPRELPIEGRAELRVSYLGKSKSVIVPLGVAVLSLDGVARVGLPVWIKVSLYDGELGYPFSQLPADFGCNQIEVRKDGKLLPRIATAASEEIGGSRVPFGRCSESGYPRAAATRRRDRIPLHLQYRFDVPGTYEIRFQLDQVWRGKLSSSWTSIEVLPATSQDRAKWLTELTAHWPSDPTALVTEYLPSILGNPDERSLELVVDALYHPDPWVRDYGVGGLTYWPDDQSVAAVAGAVRTRGVTDAGLRFLVNRSPLSDTDRRDIIENAILKIRSDDPVLLRGAVTALRNIVLDPKWQIDEALRKRAEAALLEAAGHVVGAADLQTVYDFAGMLRGVRSDRAREILWSFVERGIALGSAISALSYRHVPEDLPKLASLASAPLAGKEQELEIDSLPQELQSYYGDSAIPYLETIALSSVRTRVRMQSARVLIRLGKPSGFACAVSLIEQDQSDREGMRGYLREQFPELRAADNATVLAFARARSKVN